MRSQVIEDSAEAKPESRNYPQSLLLCHIHGDVRFGRNVKLGFNNVIERGCEIGDDTLIAHNCVLRPNTKIGARCKIGHGVVFEGDGRVGDDVVIQPMSIITREAIVEDKVFIGPFYVGLNDPYMCHLRRTFIPRAPILGYACRIGGSVTVLPGVTIYPNAMVGAGSVVTKDIPEGQIWFGDPAKFYAPVPREEWL